jgi:hypothetical protein
LLNDVARTTTKNSAILGCVKINFFSLAPTAAAAARGGEKIIQ